MFLSTRMAHSNILFLSKTVIHSRNMLQSIIMVRLLQMFLSGSVAHSKRMLLSTTLIHSCTMILSGLMARFKKVLLSVPMTHSNHLFLSSHMVRSYDLFLTSYVARYAYGLFGTSIICAWPNCAMANGFGGFSPLSSSYQTSKRWERKIFTVHRNALALICCAGSLPME